MKSTPQPQTYTYEDALAGYLTAVLEQDDFASFLDALGHLARGNGVAEVARQTGLGRESLYKSLGKDAKPRFETVCRVLRSLGLQLVVRAPQGPSR